MHVKSFQGKCRTEPNTRKGAPHSVSKEVHMAGTLAPSNVLGPNLGSPGAELCSSQVQLFLSMWDWLHAYGNSQVLHFCSTPQNSRHTALFQSPF